MGASVNVGVEISKKRIADLLCGAFEGGIGYWASIARYKKPKKVWAWDTAGGEGPVYRYVQYPLSAGGAVILSDEDGAEHVLDMKAIERGLQLMQADHPSHFADFLNGQDDAVTSDVFVQCCVLGEVVYG